MTIKKSTRKHSRAVQGMLKANKQFKAARELKKLERVVLTGTPGPKGLERLIEQAAARGDRDEVKRLTGLVSPKAPKAPKAPKPTKAPKLAQHPLANAVDADDVLDAVKNAKAPKGKDLRAVYLQWLAMSSKEFSQSYVNSLRRPVGDFVDWCSKSTDNISLIDTKMLERYRAHAVKQGHAISTLRMGLARVQTFLRFAVCVADLKVLRIQHTKAEKRAQAQKAAA